MPRRIGYGLGLLFVLACVAAYPLTWGRWYTALYDWPYWRVLTEIETGQLRLAAGRDDNGRVYRGFGGFSSKLRPFPEHFYTFDARSIRDAAGPAWHVKFPLWMPALAVSLFMAWRWRRRRRTRRRAVGFPVADRSA